MRESTVEAHLHKQVVAAGGWTYKFTSPGRRNVPDRIVIWPEAYTRLLDGKAARVDFVECKAPRKKARPAQVREHVRLKKLNCEVLVLDTKKKVDLYVGRNK